MDTGGAKKSSLGMDEKTAAGLACLGGVLSPFVPFLWIFPLVVIFIEKESRLVKFHAIQTLCLVVVAAIIGFVSWILMFVLIGFITILLTLVPWIFNIIQCIKAFQGEAYKVPIVGNLAEQWAGGSE